jgi:alpha-D-ribose 1-methylphosphonate 5-triphosphate synthase subunit PhnH
MTTAAEMTMTPGFSAPVSAAQRTFRAALEALSHPGRIVAVTEDLLPPAPLDIAAAAFGLAMLDHETPLWLDRPLQPAADYFRFHCGCPIAAAPDAAQFALLADAASMPPLAAFRHGSDEYPDGSATLILEVAELAADGPLLLSGPGIDGRARLGIAGLPAGFWRDWHDNHGAFPRGVDIFFTCGALICGLPRTTDVRS